MEIVNEGEIHKLARRHANARRPAGHWIEVTRIADWHSFADIRKTFNSADYVQELIVFNLGGNNFRLIASVDFESQEVYVIEVLTHAEYDRWIP